MELNTLIRVAVFLFFVISNTFVINKDRLNFFDKFLFVTSAAIVCYNGTKLVFEF